MEIPAEMNWTVQCWLFIYSSKKSKTEMHGRVSGPVIGDFTSVFLILKMS